LDRICGAIHKKYGKEAITFLGNNEPETLPRISCQCPQLDSAMGGGLPEGRIIELYGPESSGKSTVCLHTIAEAQRCYPEVPVAIVDVEYSFDPIYAANIGVDVPNLMVSQPTNGTEALNILVDLIEQGVKLVIVDSVAALLPQEEDDAGLEDKQMGVHARMMSRGLRKINAAAGRHGTTIIFTNQVREKIGVVYGNPETTPGGRALRFYASVRVRLSQSGTIKEGTEKVAQVIKASVTKNKTAAPFKSTTFTIRFDGKGIDRIEDLINTCLAAGVIKKSGSWFSHKDQQLSQGRTALRKLIEEDASIRKMLQDETKDVALVVTSAPDEKEGKDKGDGDDAEAGVESSDV
jgi:recombination protein RecA